MWMASGILQACRPHQSLEEVMLAEITSFLTFRYICTAQKSKKPGRETHSPQQGFPETKKRHDRRTWMQGTQELQTLFSGMCHLSKI